MGTPQAMGSHRPVLMAILDIFQPKSAMEFGMGLNSTPVLWEKVPLFVTIENDLSWYNRMVGELPPRDGAIPIHHKLGGGMHAKTKPHQFPPDIRSSCKEFYRELGDKYGKMDMMFVDHFAVLRILALNCMYHLFDIIAFHDTEHPGYFYDKFTSRNLSGYQHFRFASMETHTDILISKAVMNDSAVSWDSALARRGREYCDQFGQPYEHRLIHLDGSSA